VASCCVGQGVNISVKDFNSFCPKAIAGIGNLPDTVADRSVPIRLERKRRGEVVARFRRKKAMQQAQDIKSKLSRWIMSITSELKDAEPVLPDELSDRQQDGSEPLFAIADQAGGAWPKMVRDAAVKIFGSHAADDQNIGVQLLTDIRLVFDEKETDRIFSDDLVAALAKIETSPWAEWKHGKPMTVIQLARQLKPFKVSPRNVRIEDVQHKGYGRDDFADAWDRYLRSESSPGAIFDIRPVPASQANVYAGETHFSTRPAPSGWDDLKSEESPIFTRVGTVGRVKSHIERESGNGNAGKLPHCPKCNWFAFYPLPSGAYECQTCGNVQ
jgi:hypothetical protein